MKRFWLALLLGCLTAPVAAQAPPGGGSVSVVTDGTTTVQFPVTIDFTSGATVTASGSTARVAVSGGGSGCTVSGTTGQIVYNSGSGGCSSSPATTDSSGDISGLGNLNVGGTINTTATAGYLAHGYTVLNEGTTAYNIVTTPSLGLGQGSLASLNLAVSGSVLGLGPGTLSSVTGSTGDTAVGIFACHNTNNPAQGIWCGGFQSLMWEIAGQSDAVTGFNAGGLVVGTNGLTATGESAGYAGTPSHSTFMGLHTSFGNASSVTIGGTVTTGDTVTLTFTGCQGGAPFTCTLTSGPESISYTAVGGDTIQSIATGLKNAFVVDARLQGDGFADFSAFTDLTWFGKSDGVIGFEWPGTATVGYAIATTYSVSGSATETVTVRTGNVGTYNNFFGDTTGSNLGATTQSNNNCNGALSLNSLQTGSSNNCNGFESFPNLITGNGNTGNGHEAGATVVGGSYSLLEGYRPGTTYPVNGSSDWIVCLNASGCTLSSDLSNVGKVQGNGATDTIDFAQMNSNAPWVGMPGQVIIGAPSGGSSGYMGVGTLNVQTRYYVNGTAGIASCTAAALGASITITGGIVTAFTGC